VLYCAAWRRLLLGGDGEFVGDASRPALLMALPFRVKISDRLHGVGAAASDSGGAASAMSDRSELTAS
jgi:hypothetical protein